MAWPLLPRPASRKRVRETILIIDLLRHGEPEGGSVYRGSTDHGLTDHGWQQMRAFCQCPGWNRLASSPLRRCYDFACELQEQHELPLDVYPEFSEIDFGEWEGQSFECLMTTDETRLRQFCENPEIHTPPGGERLADFRRRVMIGWQRLLDSSDQDHVLVITHAGVIRVVLQSLLGIPYPMLFRITLPYAAAVRIRIGAAVSGSAQWEMLTGPDIGE